MMHFSFIICILISMNQVNSELFVFMNFNFVGFVKSTYELPSRTNIFTSESQIIFRISIYFLLCSLSQI